MRLRAPRASGALAITAAILAASGARGQVQTASVRIPGADLTGVVMDRPGEAIPICVGRANCVIAERAEIRNVVLDVTGSRVRARGTLAMTGGPGDLTVTCTGAPGLVGSDRLELRHRRCEGVGWPIDGRLEALAEGRTVDLLGRIREGRVARFTSDGRFGPARAPGCISAIRSVMVTSGAVDVVVELSCSP